MTDSDRRDFLKATGTVGAAAMLGLAGCSGGPSADEGSPNGTASGETTHVGMVYAAGGIGDGSFNDQAQQGIEQAADELPVEYQEAQPEDSSQFGNYQQQFASSSDPDYDLVSCIGFLQADALASNAADYPDQDFQIIDEAVDADNVASYAFREHEGSYLVGVMTALLTTSDFSAGAGATASDSTNVGFVGGVEGDVIARFEAGYKAGIKATEADVDVQTTYIGSFDDSSAAREAALAMYNSGSDIVYHAAGSAGTGVFEAAQQQGRFAVGVDRAQSVTRSGYADVILGSMVKRVDTAVYDCVERVVNGEFPGGESTTLGLDDDGVSLLYGDQLGDSVPDDVKTAVDDARSGILDGDVSVPTDPGEV